MTLGVQADEQTLRYYRSRAAEYDETSYGVAEAAGDAELGRLRDTLHGLVPARTLDVGCGTGFVTRFLPGEIVGVDQSDEMLAIARERVRGARFLRASAPPLPFPDGSFERVFASNFYGHLPRDARRLFVDEARRVAPELVIVDCAWHPGLVEEGLEERFLRDGSRFVIHKCYFRPETLRVELDGGEIFFLGETFVAVRRVWSTA
jgi:SAM-dependent methyltransferase